MKTPAQWQDSGLGFVHQDLIKQIQDDAQKELLERLESAKLWLDEQAQLADKSSKEWEESDPVNSAYRNGMWYAYNDCRNKLGGKP